MGFKYDSWRLLTCITVTVLGGLDPRVPGGFNLVRGSWGDGGGA